MDTLRLVHETPRRRIDTGNLVGLLDGYTGDVKRLMQRVNLIKGPREEGSDWKKIAPRWFLLLVVIMGAGIIGALASRLEMFKDSQLARLESSLNDGPTKYQARLSERVAVVEAQTQLLSAAVRDLTIKMEAQTDASKEVAYQLKLLNAEMKARR